VKGGGVGGGGVLGGGEVSGGVKAFSQAPKHHL
jgi:hypothetical protein